jgi:hypothetical protein
MRDVRIDFFRGLAIYMIFVDHVVGDPLAKLTYQHLGFSDAAEIFVFLSGLTCGIAYSRVLERMGSSALMSTLTKRAWRIYFYYALSCVLVLLANAAFHISQQHPFNSIWAALVLFKPPVISDILVLYIVLTLLLVPAFLLPGERNWLSTLAISSFIWGTAQIFADFPAALTHRWYFNPCAWQFLFAIGLVVGMKWDTEKPVLSFLSQKPWLVASAWLVVIGTLLYKVVSSRIGLNVDWLRIDAYTASTMKQNLSPLRLVHFLSVALLVGIYVRQNNPILKWSICKPVIQTGMHSLEVFSLSIVLDCFVNIVVLAESPSLGVRLLMDCMGFLLLALTAAAFTHRTATVARHHMSNLPIHLRRTAVRRAGG